MVIYKKIIRVSIKSQSPTIYLTATFKEAQVNLKAFGQKWEG
jgi:hypothetical protein